MTLNQTKQEQQEAFKRILAFCILMENGKGIIDKSPDYIMEKFQRYISSPSVSNEYEWGLDSNNREKLINYIATWV